MYVTLPWGAPRGIYIESASGALLSRGLTCLLGAFHCDADCIQLNSGSRHPRVPHSQENLRPSPRLSACGQHGYKWHVFVR